MSTSSIFTFMSPQRNLLLSLVLAAIAAASLVQAHFQLVSPTIGRGFIDGDDPCTECIAPCGSFNTPANRISFPASNGVVSMQMLDGSGTVTFYYATDSNNVNGTEVVIPNVSYNFEGSSGEPTVHITIPSLPSTAVLGQEGTIQVVYTSDEVFYQCLDITVSSAATASVSLMAVLLTVATLAFVSL